MFKNIICETNTNHEPGYIFKSKCCSDWLLMCFKTPFYYIADNKHRSGEAGHLLLHKPGEEIEHGHTDNNSSFINDWIYFECDDRFMDNVNIKVNIPVKCSDICLFTKLIDSINSEEIKNDKYSSLIISNNIHNLILQYMRDSDSNYEIPEKIEYARNTVLGNPQFKWKLEDMAKLSGYSISRFSNLYTEYYGISPVNELINVRIDKSKYFLRLKSYSITEISEMCGFSSVHYFSKCFKSRCGTSPMSYIEKTN